MQGDYSDRWSGHRFLPGRAVGVEAATAGVCKPMIYYPLSGLMIGIRDLLIISTPQHILHFEQLLGDGSQWGMIPSYCMWSSPDDFGQTFILGTAHYVIYPESDGVVEFEKDGNLLSIEERLAKPNSGML